MTFLLLALMLNFPIYEPYEPLQLPLLSGEDAKAPGPPYNEWEVKVIFTTKHVRGEIRTCIFGTVAEVKDQARQLAYDTIKGPHTVHTIAMRSGCPEEYKDDKEED